MCVQVEQVGGQARVVGQGRVVDLIRVETDGEGQGRVRSTSIKGDVCAVCFCYLGWLGERARSGGLEGRLMYELWSRF